MMQAQSSSVFITYRDSESQRKAFFSVPADKYRPRFKTYAFNVKYYPFLSSCFNVNKNKILFYPSFWNWNIFQRLGHISAQGGQKSQPLKFQYLQESILQSVYSVLPTCGYTVSNLPTAKNPLLHDWVRNKPTILTRLSNHAAKPIPTLPLYQTVYLSSLSQLIINQIF